MVGNFWEKVRNKYGHESGHIDNDNQDCCWESAIAEKGADSHCRCWTEILQKMVLCVVAAELPLIFKPVPHSA